MSLTDEGLKFAKQINAIHHEIAHLFCEALDESEREEFHRSLKKINQILEKE